MVDSFDGEAKNLKLTAQSVDENTTYTGAIQNSFDVISGQVYENPVEILVVD